MKKVLKLFAFVLISSMAFGQENNGDGDSILFDSAEFGTIIINDSFTFNFESEQLVKLNKQTFEINAITNATAFGDVIPYTFGLSNPTDVRLSVLEIERSCACISIPKPTIKVSPGQTIDFETNIDFVLDKSYTIKLNIIFTNDEQTIFYYQPVDLKITINE